MCHERDSTRPKDRVRQSQRWADSLPSSQPCDHPSRRPDRQHALLLFTLQVNGVSGPLLLVCTSQRLCRREKITEREHLGDCASDWATDGTMLWQGSLLSAWRSVLHLDQKYFVSVLWAENPPTHKLFGSWIWSISHVLNSVYPWAYKNTGVISP